ncbi:hypothetical protein N408_01200 [Helicobacter pylori FD703]|nr:hypothetical protein N408_01200 [Helicobacter pylori FD703]
MALDNFLTCFEFSFTSFATEPNQNPIFIQSLAVWF